MTDPAQHLTRVRLLNDAGRHDEALRALAAVLAQAPDAPDVLGELARTLLGRGDLQQALHTARALGQQAPSWYYGPYLAALTLHRLKDFAGAVAAAREAIRRAPDNPACHRALAWAASDLPGSASLALQAATHAVALEPHNAQNHLCVGTAALDLDRATAERAFAEALRL
ncbi:MAG TPA: tetratricopeptide repeat protein, partial [Kineosporiaceae bacterium]